MELRKATPRDYRWIMNAVCRKHLDYCTTQHIMSDFGLDRLYAVVDGDKVLATVSLVYDSEYQYTAIKRLCILNKKNRGKGIARFALSAIQKEVKGRIGATPWWDNEPMRHILESQGFIFKYTFNYKWCFYMKEV